MAVILSTDLNEVKVQARGNWFTFQPNKAKHMDDGLAHFLCTDKSYLGFVGLPDVCLEDPASEEAVTAKKEATSQGRQNIILHLQKIVHNLEASLQRDLDIAGIKGDVLKYASTGERDAYKRLAALSAEQSKVEEAKVDEIKKLKEQISGNTIKS